MLAHAIAPPDWDQQGLVNAVLQAIYMELFSVGGLTGVVTTGTGKGIDEHARIWASSRLLRVVEHRTGEGPALVAQKERNRLIVEEKPLCVVFPGAEALLRTKQVAAAGLSVVLVQLKPSKKLTITPPLFALGDL